MAVFAQAGPQNMSACIKHVEVIPFGYPVWYCVTLLCIVLLHIAMCYLKPAADATDFQRGNAFSIENNLAAHAGHLC